MQSDFALPQLYLGFGSGLEIVRPKRFDILTKSRFHCPWQDQGRNLHYRLVFGHQNAFIYVKASSNAKDRIKKCLSGFAGENAIFMGYYISVCWLILIQTQTTTSTVAEAAGAVAEGAGAAEGAPRGFFQDFQYMLPIMAAIMALYFILLRPQQPDQDKATGSVKNLKKNDRVLTVGGIVGTVVSSPEQSEFTTIRIDESNNTKIQVRTVSIARVMTDDDQKSGSAAKK